MLCQRNVFYASEPTTALNKEQYCNGFQVCGLIDHFLKEKFTSGFMLNSNAKTADFDFILAIKLC